MRPLSRPGDINALAASLIRLLDDAPLRARLRIKQPFTPKPRLYAHPGLKRLASGSALPPTEQLSAGTNNFFPAPAVRQKRAHAACR